MAYSLVRDPNALLFNAGRLGNGPTSTVANLEFGTQLGVGATLPHLDSATPLILPPLVPIVTNVPAMFNYLPGFAKICRYLFEQCAQSIEGVDFQYLLENAESPAGQDGQNMAMPTNSRRSPVNPSFTFPNDLTGMLIWNYIKEWIGLIKSPDTQASKLSAIGLDSEFPQLFSTFTMTMLFIQPDTTLSTNNIIDAYFVTNMWPSETGMAGFKRSIGQNTTTERTIPFHGIVQHNPKTKVIGQKLWDIMQLNKINYENATPVAFDIEGLIARDGLSHEAQTKLSEFV